MKTVETPARIFQIAAPAINTEQMLDYLREITTDHDGGQWWNRVGAKIALGEIPAAEGLIEFMGRLCYRSWEVGLNPNVQKIREDRDEYLTNVLRSGHGSVLAHAHFSFAIRECSRVLTAELNRHVAGTDISEQSLRFVRLDNLSYWQPPGLSQESEVQMQNAVRYLEKTMGDIIRREFTDDMPFSEKKILTSKIRRIAPLGLATEEGWSGNIRTLRHVIEMRSSHGAEEEIRIFARHLYEKMSALCPLLFKDYRTEYKDDDPTPAYKTEFRKV